MPKNEIRTAPTVNDKVRFLARPGTYTPAPPRVEIVETHMSWVFLAGDRVYKFKKPVRCSFLDFSSLEQRKVNCEDELRLNRRLAPDAYLGIRALRQQPDGGLSLDGAGHVVEWLVEMRRLPEDLTLESMIGNGRLTPDDIDRVCDVLVGFYGALPPVGMSATDFIDQFEAEHAQTRTMLVDPNFGLDGPRVTALLDDYSAAFEAARPLLVERVQAGRIVEGHGDLRPEHVFLTEPPAIIDCLEFSRRLRLLDPFEEIAFLGLECARLGADWVFGQLRQRVAEGLDDPVPSVLLSFYWRYRALLRARLALAHLTEPIVRKPNKWRPQARDYAALAEQAELRTRRQEDR